MENRKLTVASSPHIKSNLRVNRIMLDVIIALVPVAAAGIYFNGIKGLILIAVTVLGSMGTEVVFKRLLHNIQVCGLDFLQFLFDLFFEVMNK